jgi:hypothetical protein
MKKVKQGEDLGIRYWDLVKRKIVPFVPANKSTIF